MHTARTQMAQANEEQQQQSETYAMDIAGEAAQPERQDQRAEHDEEDATGRFEVCEEPQLAFDVAIGHVDA